MKIYLYNPDNGSSIKGWYDGTSFWKLGISEVAAFPEDVGLKMKRTYGFLRQLTLEEFEIQLAKLEKTEVAKITVSDEGKLVPKTEEEIASEKAEVEETKKKVKKMKKQVEEAKDAEPDKLEYWEMSRGALINEINKREIEVKELNKKGIKVSKEQLINILESDDINK